MNMPPSFDLSRRNALITGGGSGLGLAIAKAVAAAGASVILVGRNSNKLSHACAELCSGSPGVSRLFMTEFDL
jgi:NAD(P)-dependent dehydrogenase (short-subunit alcohol dehydrogenase family)